jgi:oligosaccharide repeat unit polymerase
MYKYLVAFVLLSPLVGIYLVETGEFAASVGITGYQNGATLAYACYAASVAVVAWLSCGRQRRPASLSETRHPRADAQFQVFAISLLWVSGAFLFLFLFGFGAIQVWAGNVGKGEFRVGLGAFGAIPNLMTKFILPALLAYAVALFCKTSKKRKFRWLLFANFTLLFFIGASWGFKTTGFMVLLPALLILYWRITLGTLFRLTAAFVLVITVFFFQFDANVEGYADVGTFLLTRITVIQGDVAWYVWDKYVSGDDFPNYWPTLLAAFGGNLMSLFGLSRSDYFTWMHYHYDLMITYIAEVPLQQIEDGHSITATPFAEGLVAGGLWGVLFFAVLAGLLVGRTFAFIQRALQRGHDKAAALASTYFCFYIFAWLNGGAIVQLFHISLWFSLMVTMLAFRIMRPFTMIKNSKAVFTQSRYSY